MAGNIASFGSGLLWATPSGANPTPIQFGALQDVTIDESRTTKTLYGQYQQPLLIGAAEIKASGKAKMGYINAAVWGSLYYGVTPSTGTTSLSANEPGTIPTTPYQVTVVNSATWVTDLGVQFSDGTQLTRVASGPTTGQYTVAAGVYTFAAADTTKAVLISYEYTQASVGKTVTAGLILQGVQPIITIDLYRGFNGTGERHRYWAAVCSKLSAPTKMTDFGIHEFDFECFTDSLGRFHNIYSDA